MLEDLTGCTHEPEVPVVDDDDPTVILYWICRCGKRCPDEKEKTDG